MYPINFQFDSTLASSESARTRELYFAVENEDALSNRILVESSSTSKIKILLRVDAA